MTWEGEPGLPPGGPDRKEDSDLERLLEGPGRQGPDPHDQMGKRAWTGKDYWKDLGDRAWIPQDQMRRRAQTVREGQATPGPDGKEGLD